MSAPTAPFWPRRSPRRAFRRATTSSVDVVNSANVVKATRARLDPRRAALHQVAHRAGLASPAAAKDFDIDMKVAPVIGANKQSIAGLELNFVASRRERPASPVARAHWRRGSSRASRGGDGGSAPDLDRRRRARHFADLYARMEGGDLDLTLQAGGESSAGGAATVTNFALRDEPAFRRLSPAAAAGAGDAVDPVHSLSEDDDRFRALARRARRSRTRSSTIRTWG